ncbi:MAG: pentapeptide repeat-containing protein [Candidatus Omnitrophota bacterium]
MRINIDPLNKHSGAARMVGVDLRKAKLAGMVFSRVSLLRVDMDAATLTGSNFESAILSGVTMRGADLREADLSRARLYGVILEEARLSGCRALQTSFAGCMLRAASLAGINAWEADFSGADLRDADLANAVVDGADFSGADLTGANVAGVNFSKAKVQGALFFYASGLTDAQRRYIEENNGLIYTRGKVLLKKAAAVLKANRILQAVLFILAALPVWSGIVHFSDPKNRSTYVLPQLAEREYMRGNSAKAIEIYRLLAARYIRDGINDLFPYVKIAAIYRLDKDFKAAADVLSGLLENKHLPKDQLAWLHEELAQVYLAGGELEKSAKEFQLSLEMQPGDPEWAYRIKMTLADIRLRQGNWQEALKTYGRILTEYKDAPRKLADAYAAIGQIYLEMDRLKEARDAFLLSIDNDVNDRERVYWVRMCLADIYRREGKLAEALQVYEGFLSEYSGLSDKIADTYLSIGYVHIDMGKLKEARDAFRLSIAKGPGTREKLYWPKLAMAGIDRQENKQMEALKIYGKLLVEYNDDPQKTADIYINIGQAYREIGKLKEAREAFLISLEKDPADRGRVYHSSMSLADIYRQEGEPTEALKIYKELLTEYGDYAGRVSEINRQIEAASRSTGKQGKI